MGIGRRRAEEGPRESNERGSDPGGGEAGDDAMFQCRETNRSRPRGESTLEADTLRFISWCRFKEAEV